MKINKLGNSGLEVSELCFGGNVFGWTVDEATSFQLLDVFFESGGNFIDTADVYSNWFPGNHGGESETIIGKWIKARNNRNKIVVATKVGMEMAPGKRGLSKKYIFASVEDSLKRLQTDYIDLYISHRDDETTSFEETSEAYGRLIEHGKIRVSGASNYTGKRLKQAIEASHKFKTPAYQTLQPLYNFYDRALFEKDLKDVCQKYNLGVTPYYSLASGFLTGKYRSEKDLGTQARRERVKSYLNDRGQKILNALDIVAEEYKATPGAIALAWLMKQPAVTSSIVSATSVAQLKDTMTSTKIELSSASLEALTRASNV